MHHLVLQICCFKQSKKCKSCSPYQLAREREENQIGVHSIRAGSLPGEHDVLFAATDEIFTIKHESFSNGIFAAGAVEAADWLKDQSPGYYKLEDLLMDKGV